MERKTVKKHRRKYDAEFKKEVLKLVESGRAIAEISESLGIGTNLVYAWKRQINKKGTGTFLDANNALDDDKMSMQKRIQQLEMERDILKKALGIFSR